MAENGRIGWAKMAFKVTLALAVLWGARRALSIGWADLQAQDWTISRLRLEWLVVAGVFYVLGLCPAMFFWRRVLRTLGQPHGKVEVARAYFVGHLGKYAPGKVLVLLLRVSLLRSKSPLVVSASVFIETLTMISIGGLVACAILLGRGSEMPLAGLGLLIAVAGAAPLTPGIAQRVLPRIFRAQGREVVEAVSAIRPSLAVRGWVELAIGWIGVGASLWATSRAAGFTSGLGIVDQLMLCTAAGALAVGAGFLSFIPGGLIVREAVMLPILATAIGEAGALVTAILARVAWILTEALVSIILYLIPRAPVIEATEAEIAEEEIDEVAAPSPHEI